MIGLAGSHGPWISFLYFWSPISHQLQIPMHRTVKLHPRITPVKKATCPPPVRVTNTPPQATTVNKIVSSKLPGQECVRSSRRNIGKRPKTSMEKSVKEKTCVVVGSREASTADAIIAEFVDMDAGSLYYMSAVYRGGVRIRAHRVPEPLL